MKTRAVNLDFDTAPSVGHTYNGKLVEKYISTKSRILDIGCWTGQLFEAISQKRIKISGIDIDKKAVNQAKKKFPAGNWKVASAVKLPFENRSFDVVAFFDVIEHVPISSENKCINEVARVLKKNGILLLSTPADNIISKFSDPAYFLMGHRHYDKKDLYRYLKKNNFVIESSWQTGGIIYITYYLTQMIIKHLFKGSLPDNKLIDIYTKLAEKSFRKRNGILAHYIVARLRI